MQAIPGQVLPDASDRLSLRRYLPPLMDARDRRRGAIHVRVDAVIVNVAIPTIAVKLSASPPEIEAVIAIYLIGYATLVVTGGRHGDFFGTKNIFMSGVAGFALTPLWCVAAIGAIFLRRRAGSARGPRFLLLLRCSLSRLLPPPHSCHGCAA